MNKELNKNDYDYILFQLLDLDQKLDGIESYENYQERNNLESKIEKIIEEKEKEKNYKIRIKKEKIKSEIIIIRELISLLFDDGYDSDIDEIYSIHMVLEEIEFYNEENNDYKELNFGDDDKIFIEKMIDNFKKYSL